MKTNVVVIGSGNVAEALCEWVSRSNNKLVQLFARNAKKGAAIAERCGCDFESVPSRLAKADIYIIAVSDKAIKEVSQSLDFGDSIVVHTSGSASINELAPAIKKKGVFYPLQTFTSGRSPRFREIPVFIEAEIPAVYEELKTFSESLSCSVHFADSVLRGKLHLAAVFVCNFVNHMYSIGDDIMIKSGLDFTVLKPLIEETAAKMLDSDNSPRAMQTGPAVRRDYTTMDRHFDLLKHSSDLRHIYKILTDSIIKAGDKDKDLFITPSC